ncbi:hypothetical protein BH18ACI5_BH18ACI5_06760 [soil metagenome]
MSDDARKKLQASLVRRHLGKRGIHGLSVDSGSGTVDVYLDESADLDRAIAKLRKDAGDLKIRTFVGRRARLS